MIIDSVGGISPNNNLHVAKEAHKSEKKDISEDYASISQAASRANEVAQVTNVVKATEDPERIEKLRQVREKMDNNEYDQLNNEQLETITSSLMRTFFG